MVYNAAILGHYWIGTTVTLLYFLFIEACGCDSTMDVEKPSEYDHEYTPSEIDDLTDRLQRPTYATTSRVSYPRYSRCSLDIRALLDFSRPPFKSVSKNQVKKITERMGQPTQATTERYAPLDTPRSQGRPATRDGALLTHRSQGDRSPRKWYPVSLGYCATMFITSPS